MPDPKTARKARQMAMIIGVVSLILALVIFSTGAFAFYGKQGGRYDLLRNAAYSLGIALGSFAMISWVLVRAAKAGRHTLNELSRGEKRLFVLGAVVAIGGLLGMIVLQGDPWVMAVFAIPLPIVLYYGVPAGIRWWRQTRR